MQTAEKYNVKKHSFKSYFVTFLLVVVIVMGVYFAYAWYQTNILGDDSSENPSLADRNTDERFLAATADAQNLNMEAASARYRELAESEQDPILKRRYTILEGFSLNNSGNYQSGIKLLKSVVADPEATDQVRAEALIAMLHVYYRSVGVEILQEIFNDGGIYAEAMGEGDLNNLADLEEAVINLYRTASDYYQYAFTQYALANAPSVFVLNNPDASEDAISEAIETARTYVNKGDVLLDIEMRSGLYVNDEENVIRDLLFMAMHLRLHTLETIARKKEDYREIVESYYPRVIEFYNDFDYLAVKSLEAYVRFYYAAYLADVYGEDRAAEIRTVLQPIYDSNADWQSVVGYSFGPFVGSVMERPIEEHNSINDMISTLSEIDSSFSEFVSVQ